MNPLGTGLVGDIARLKSARTLRESSWDRTGRNRDCWSVNPGEKRMLADLQGPGCLTHIWADQALSAPNCTGISSLGSALGSKMIAGRNASWTRKFRV